jgi:uncharacterized protein DUF4157
MSERAGKTRANGSPPALQRAVAKAPTQTNSGGRAGLPGLLQGAGPALGLGVQRQVAVGEPGDRFEREADATADRVSAGESVEPAAISPVTPETLAQTAAQPAMPEKMPEAMPVQKAEAMPEKMPKAMPVQKAEAMPEKNPETIPVQKAEAMPEKKPETMPAQKAEAMPEKMPEAMPVQKAEAMPEKKPETMPVQKAGAVPEEKKPVQTEAAGGNAPTPAPSMGAVASEAIASKGVGKPIEPATRGTLESRLGTDFSGVRVHDDSAARASADALNARAFTHGNDIWLGPGASQNDTRLMAHEATHVVQQSGGAHRMVQRANGGGQPGAAAGAGKGAKKPDYPPADLIGNVVKIPKLRLPSYGRKANAEPFPLTLPNDTTRPPEQRQFWASHIPDASYKENIRDKVKEKNVKPVHSTRTNTDIYYLKPAADPRKNIIGDAGTLPDKLTTPTWDSTGAYHSYDVDHIKEVQLVGKDEAQNIDNMELLDSSANRSSGASIAADIDAKTSAAVRQLGEEAPPKIPKNITDLAGLRANKYMVEFEDKDAIYKVSGNPDKDFWSKEAVRRGDQVAPLRPMTKKEIEDIRGDPTRLTLMTTRGLRLRDIDHWDKGKTDYPRPNFFPAFDLATVTYDPESGGEMSGTLLPKHPPLAPQPVTWKINQEPGIEYGGTLTVGLKTLGLTGLSPIQIDEVDLGPRGLIARGVVQPTVPLLKGATLDFRIEGPDVEISKTFSGSELSAPGPIKISGSSLTVALSRSQLKATGDVDFEIERLGRGQISGTGAFGGQAGKGFGVKGYFELDKSVFDGEARIDAGYENVEFWAKGHLSISAGKIRGIKSASLDASYAKDAFSASGSVVPDIPAVEQAGLSVEYDPKIGLKFAGDLAVKADTPGIGSGKLHVEAFQPAGGDRFKVSGSGSAKPKIPGIESELKVAYDDGTFDASVTAAYNKGRLQGSVLVGATNRPVTDGMPSGPAPEKGDHVTVYGSGSVTVVIAPWLQGKVGVRLLPNGEVMLAGEIGLPSTLDIFPEKKLDKNIFTLHIDIPIFGITVPVVDTHIGIFATVEGGLDVNAGIGPGQLQQLGLKVDYNPSHEEDTHVGGGARLHVPANAGLRAFVSGGLGAGIPLVDATAKLTIGAGLGLEGALDTGVQVDWTPAKGLTLDADASVYVEPKLKVSVIGSVDVTFDTFVHTFHLYHHDWDLAAFEYGSNLRFGVCFPVHYDEGKGFDLSLDKVRFQVPDIKPKEILSDVISRIV